MPGRDARNANLPSIEKGDIIPVECTKYWKNRPNNAQSKFHKASHHTLKEAFAGSG